MADDCTAHNQTLENVTRALLHARNAAGHWEGELSSSALSTATAIFALSTYESSMADGINPPRRHQIQAMVNKGLDWLCNNQNTDGGWGDTIISISNISTTALCWAALSVGDESVSAATAKAEAWLAKAAGSLEPAKLAAAIKARYGKDKTFSVPILTMCALAGRLDGDSHVLQSNSVGSASRTDSPRQPQMVRDADPTNTLIAGDSVGSALADASSHGATPTQTRPPGRTLRETQSRSERAAWRFVPQLPFELAACPHQWFQWLKLPVVSYALPALIAIGHARHANRPTWNPLARIIRRLTKNRTLRVLEQIQPKGGGFLEATPLTSFVVMSLVGSGQCQHPVTANGIDFLIRSMRPDGSWPIDTNLSTWVTTLSINALAHHPDFDRILSHDDRLKLKDWLLGQQYRVEHPYTHAAPGAWAWTDLPGGVPDADDTAGALLALWNLGFRDAQVLDAVNAAVNWLIDLQNRDGGIPTFCRGWGNLPFDRSGCDLTAHALHAWATWRSSLSPDTQLKLDKATQCGLAYLRQQQRTDGAWTPLWFGNQFAPDDENSTYGTARVLTQLCAMRDPSHPKLNVSGGRASSPAAEAPHELAAVAAAEDGRPPGGARSRREESDRQNTNDAMIVRGAAWLLQSQNPDGGWGGGPETPSSIEETSLAVNALDSYRECAVDGNREIAVAAVQRGIRWLQIQTDHGQKFPPAPIGLYFAKLWYFERSYPSIFSCAALARSAVAANQS